MPVIQTIFQNEDIQADIWHITETAEALAGVLGLTGTDLSLCNSFKHQGRKKHWLAARCALKTSLGASALTIHHEANGKPVLGDGDHHISLSHSGDYAASVHSLKHPVGIDIEQLKPRIFKVRERFLSPEELGFISTEMPLEHLYVLWCGKEALYKIYGNPGIDFRNDIRIHPFDYLCNPGSFCSAAITTGGTTEVFRLHYRKMGDYMIAIAWS